MVGSKIIRHDTGAGNNHRVGGRAANPTLSNSIARTGWREQRRAATMDCFLADHISIQQ
jgi:hypothetical protein